MSLNLGQIKQMVLDAQGQDEMAQALAKALLQVRSELADSIARKTTEFVNVGKFKVIGGAILFEDRPVDVLISRNLDEATASRKGFVVGSRLQSHEFLRAIVERQQKGQPLSEADEKALVLYQTGIRDDEGVLYRQASGFISYNSEASTNREQGLGGTFFVKAPAELY